MTPCHNCGAAHHIQACPEIRALLFREEDYSDLFEEHTPGPCEAFIESILTIRDKIAKQGEHWITRNTQRQLAADAAMLFVDPSYEVAQ